MIALGFTGNELIFNNQKIEITGVYGETIPLSEIKSIELVKKRPGLSRKIHGFSIGYRKKGYFKTKDGEKIKAIINKDYLPWILIIKETGEHIYFSSGKGSNEKLFKKIEKTLPNNGYNPALLSQ